MGLISDGFSFIHLSDTHLLETPEEDTRGVKPYKKLQEAITSITQLEYKPNFSIITGDLTDNGSPQGYKQLKQQIARLEEHNIPTLLVLGNHDNREHFRQVFTTDSTNGPYYYSRELNGIRVIVLDSMNPGQDTGCFTGDQLSWLQSVLKESPNQPTIIALHHPVNLASLYLWDKSYGLDQRNRFYKIIDGCNILSILNGHLHHNQSLVVNGVLHLQATSTYAELCYNDDEYWLRNTLGYNQVIHRNNALYAKSITLPCDGRLLSKGSIKQLLA